MAHNHTMKAARWEGKVASISVEDVPIPRLQDPLDAIVRLTSTTICGTDLHIFRGRFVTDPGYTLGHGAMGIITALGSAITTLKIGDHVVVTGVLERGTENGEESPAGYLGIGHFQGDPSPVVNGGQAEYLRVPFANVNVLGLLQGVGNQLDYLLLADIWPTAWFGLECAGQVLGDTVVCFGAGPVGSLGAYSALLRGALRVYVVDQVPSRLAKAKFIGAIPINFRENDPVKEIVKLESNGVDQSIDYCGFECVNRRGEKVPNTVLTWAVKVTRESGGIGVIGVYVPFGDSGAPESDQAQGIIPIPVGQAWLKSLSIKGGSTVRICDYQELLKKLIEKNGAKPSFIFDKEFKIENAQKAYEEFSDHKIIKPYFQFGRHHHGH